MTAPTAPPSYEQAVKFDVSDEKSPLKEPDVSDEKNPLKEPDPIPPYMSHLQGLRMVDGVPTYSTAPTVMHPVVDELDVLGHPIATAIAVNDRTALRAKNDQNYDLLAALAAERSKVPEQYFAGQQRAAAEDVNNATAIATKKEQDYAAQRVRAAVTGQPIAAAEDVNTATALAAKRSLLKRAISLPTQDEQEERAGWFSGESVRHAFIRKVYSILMVQLSITVGFICLFTWHHPSKMFVHKNLWLLYTNMGLMLAFLFPMACIEPLRRKVPINYIFLFGFTICMSYMVGFCASVYEVDAVLIAAGLTAGVTLVLTIFAIQTKLDFTAARGALACLLFIVTAFGIIMIFIPRSENFSVLNVVYGAVGAFVFSLYLIYDTQMMVGGGHKYSISPEEYVFAALALYLDIINIFLYILKIVGEAKKD